MYWDIATERELTAPARRILVISSPGHFNVDAPTMRAIVLMGSATVRNAGSSRSRAPARTATRPSTTTLSSCRCG